MNVLPIFHMYTNRRVFDLARRVSQLITRINTVVLIRVTMDFIKTEHDGLLELCVCDTQRVMVNEVDIKTLDSMETLEGKREQV